MPEKEREEEYIKAAIRLGSETDHLPIMHHFQVIFFRGRMKMEELPECEDTVELLSQISGENTGKNRD